MALSASGMQLSDDLFRGGRGPFGSAQRLLVIAPGVASTRGTGAVLPGTPWCRHVLVPWLADVGVVAAIVSTLAARVCMNPGLVTGVVLPRAARGAVGSRSRGNNLHDGPERSAVA